MAVKRYLIILFLFSLYPAYSQKFEIDIGVGITRHQIQGNKLQINDSIFAGPSGNVSGNPTFNLRFNYYLTNFVSVGVGWKVFSGSVSYKAEKKDPYFGGYLTKLTLTPATSHQLPINLNIMANPHIFLHVGTGISINDIHNIEPLSEIEFIDAPSLEQLSYNLQKALKPNYYFIEYGGSIKYWKLKLRILYKQSIGVVTRKFEYNKSFYNLKSSWGGLFFELSYSIDNNSWPFKND